MIRKKKLQLAGGIDPYSFTEDEWSPDDELFPYI